MSTWKIRAAVLAAASLVVLPSAATDLWHPAPGEAGFTTHPDHLASTVTREQFLARFAQERRAMAEKGYRWDALYGTYVFVGPGSPPAEAGTMTRDEFLAKEAEQDRTMRDKGMKWNQLLGTWQSTR